MENWGLITYREVALLYQEGTPLDVSATPTFSQPLNVSAAPTFSQPLDVSATQTSGRR